MSRVRLLIHYGPASLNPRTMGWPLQPDSLSGVAARPEFERKDGLVRLAVGRANQSRARRSVRTFVSYPECRDARRTCRSSLITISPSLLTDSASGRWTWRADIAGEPVASFSVVRPGADLSSEPGQLRRLDRRRRIRARRHALRDRGAADSVGPRPAASHDRRRRAADIGTAPPQRPRSLRSNLAPSDASLPGHCPGWRRDRPGDHGPGRHVPRYRAGKPCTSRAPGLCVKAA